MAIRHAICNEIFEGWDFREACRFIRAAGYQGIEVAHYTLADDPADISAADRKHYRETIEDSGLKFVGLHWLMVAPKGLHVTTPDDGLRAQSWDHIRRLIGLCADLGPGGVMDFGSPKQRGTTGGATREEATRRFVDGLAAVAPEAREQGVTILVEALPLDQTDVVLSLEEAVGIVKEIDNPAIRTMFDTHNAVDEKEPHADLVDRYFEFIRHVHVNETDGGHCGTGDYDFRPILEVLARRRYAGWVSLEAFQFEPGAEKIATESIRHLNNIVRTIPAA
jgi:sugar phosphate isomerase/epimerase